MTPIPLVAKLAAYNASKHIKNATPQEIKLVTIPPSINPTLAAV
jgi:hypothetical protein